MKPLVLLASAGVPCVASCAEAAAIPAASAISAAGPPSRFNFFIFFRSQGGFRRYIGNKKHPKPEGVSTLVPLLVKKER